MKIVRVGDNGVNIRLRVINDETGEVENLSTATVIRYDIEKPDRSVVSVNGSLLTDGTDGIVTCATTSSHINAGGIYSVQLYLVTSSGTFRCSMVQFKADKILVP